TGRGGDPRSPAALPALQRHDHSFRRLIDLATSPRVAEWRAIPLAASRRPPAGAREGAMRSRRPHSAFRAGIPVAIAAILLAAATAKAQEIVTDIGAEQVVA